MSSVYSSFAYAFNAIMPIVLLIMLGVFLRKIKLFNLKFFDNSVKFCFCVCLPTYLFYEVYSIKSIKNIEFNTCIFAVIIILILFFTGMLIVKRYIPDNRQKGVVVQCFYRSTFAVLGLPLAKALENQSFESVNGGTVEVLTAVTIPLFNMLAVVALSMYVDKSDNRINWKKIGVNIVKNPLIIGIFIGILCLCVREFIPTDSAGERVFTIENNLPVIFGVVKKVANVAPGFMMIALGGQFDIEDTLGMKKQIALATILRVVVAPVFALSCALALSEWLHIFSFNAENYIAFIALFASPVASSSAVMAAQMGNDAKLANQLVVWTSIGSMFAVFVYVVVLRNCGII